MKELLKLMSEFEDRNNISIVLELHGDGSWILEEFWDDDELSNGATADELLAFLANTQYQLSPEGYCLKSNYTDDEGITYKLGSHSLRYVWDKMHDEDKSIEGEL